MRNNTNHFSFLREAETLEYIPIDRLLVSSSFIEIFEVIQISTGRKYIAKIIDFDKLKGYENNIEKEIHIMQYYTNNHSLINDSGLLKLIDCFKIAYNGQTHIFTIFDLCDQNDLFDFIYNNGSFPENKAKNIMRSLFKTVNNLHHCGIVHRDIKAENILLKNDKPILADFGLAEFCQLNEKSLTEYCGSRGTTAPEIIKNEPYGSKCDIYSLGILTYFLLAGYRPFDWTKEPGEEMEAVLNNGFYYPEESFSNISLEALDFINECMAIDPNERLSAEEALEHPWLKE